MKKTIKFLAPFAVCVLLAGCSTNKGPVDNRTTIIFSTTAGKESQAVLNDYIASFEKEHKDLHVKLDIVGGSYSDCAKQTIDGFATGKHPDMVMVYPDAVADFIDYGYAYPLDSYMNDPVNGLTPEDKADYIGTFLKEGQQYRRNGTFSLPMSKSTEMMFYDADKLLKLQLPGVNGGQRITEEYMNTLTWDELFNNFCPAVVKYADEHPGFIDKSHQKGWGVIGYDSDPNLFITLAEQYNIPYTKIEDNAGKILFNNDDMKTLVKKFSDMAQKNYIMTSNSRGERPNNIFTADGCLLSIGSTGGVKYQYSTDNPKKLYVAPIPQKEKDTDGHHTKSKVILQGPSVAFLKHKSSDGTVNKARQEASWLFYKHITTKENALEWSLRANYMPIRQSGFDSEDYKSISDPTAVEDPKSFDAVVARVNELLPELSNDYYSSPAFKGSNAARDNVDKIMAGALTIDATKTQAERHAYIDSLFDKAYNDTILKL